MAPGSVLAGHAVPAMAHRGLEALPVAAGIAGLPVAARIGLNVVPGTALVAAVRGQRRAVLVGRLVVFVAAAELPIVRVVVAAPVGVVIAGHAHRRRAGGPGGAVRAAGARARAGVGAG